MDLFSFLIVNCDILAVVRACWVAAMGSGFSLGLDAPNNDKSAIAPPGAARFAVFVRWGVDVGCGAGCPLGLIKFEMPGRNTGLRFSRSTI